MNAISLAIITTARAALARQTLRLARRSKSPTVRGNLKSLARTVRPCRMPCQSQAVAMVVAVTLTMPIEADAFTVMTAPLTIALPIATPNESPAEAKPDATDAKPAPATIGGTLPPTKTHKSRTWAFEPSNDRTQPGTGIITIVQGKEADTYGVDVLDGDVLFAKLDAEADVYAVRLDADRQPARCTCRGHARFKTCKHTDTTRAMTAAGLLTDFA